MITKRPLKLRLEEFETMLLNISPRIRGMILVLPVCVLWSVIGLLTDGTGDDGDSIMHYLYARYAFLHPENFLNHWAKPLFVLITALPAQLGFVGIKLFNILCISATSWLTYLIALKFRFLYPWLIFALFLLSNATYSFGFSGLTEPLFALWLSAGILFLISNGFALGTIWLSFLPFIRSEGLIIIVVIAVYLFIKRKGLNVLLLGVGHLVYGLLGLTLYKDFFWIFNRNPYATLKGVYGSGEWWHYALHMDQILTLSLCILLVMGLIKGAHLLLAWINSKFSHEWGNVDELFLIYGLFIAFFIAHSLFWYLGIFNSFGLMRVFLGVLPLMLLIVMRGNMVVVELFGLFKHRKRLTLAWIIGFLVLSGVLLVRSLKFRNSLGLNDIQLAMNEVYRQNADSLAGYAIISDSPYAAFLTKTDYFDPKQFRRIKSIYSGEPLPEKSAVFWEDWFSVFDSQTDFDDLINDKRFSFMGEASSQSVYPWAFRKSAIFKLKPEFADLKLIRFEDFENTSNTLGIDTLFAYSGTHCQYINVEQPYSEGVEVFVGGLIDYLDDFIVLEAWVLCPEGNCKTKAVFSYENQYKPYHYKAFDVGHHLDGDTWVKVKFQQRISRFIQADDKLKIYFWNPSAAKFFIDDLKIYLDTETKKKNLE